MTIVIAADKKDGNRYAAKARLSHVTIVTPSNAKKTAGHVGEVHVTARGRAHARYRDTLATVAPHAYVIHVEQPAREDNDDRPQRDTADGETPQGVQGEIPTE